VRTRHLVALAGAALLLAGCGSDLHPGAAVQVGDERVALDHVDEVTDDLCESAEDQLVEASQAVPLSYLRSAVVGTLTIRELGDQLAEEYDVTPGPAYRTELEKIRDDVDEQPEKLQDSLIEFQSTDAYVTAIVRQAGQASLEEDGVAEPTVDDSLARGQELLTTYSRDAGVEIDPRFGLDFSDADVIQADRSVSLAVTDLAKAATADEPDPEYTKSLPDSQRCG
jgi:hypothetical protein